MRLLCGLSPTFLVLLCHLYGGVLALKDDDGLTLKHEKGRCAMRGHCGKQGIFGGELPCPDNGLAEEPDDELREKLVDICGDKWNKGPVCCAEEQVDALTSNLKLAENIISSCPACQANFFNLFCTFTCSPDQSLFVNITSTEEKNDKLLVTELDNLWSDEYGAGFYDSCKDVKFGATNTRAMVLIGENAKNYTQLLTALGRKKLGGSPFQINFPRPDKDAFPGMKPLGELPHPCDSSDTNYRCACQDCEASCPELPDLSEDQYCYVGAWPCLSFAIVIVYAVFLVLLITAVSGHVAYRKHAQSRSERLRLLQDTEASDDEDDEDGEIVYNAGVLDRPTRKYALNTFCDRLFSNLGRTCARFPAVTISVSLLVTIFLSLGWLRFQVETDPVRLWVAPDSATAEEKDFFDSNFGLFYRAEQVFLVNGSSSYEPGPVMSYDTLKWWSSVEEKVRNLRSDPSGVKLDDVCYKPTGEACVVQSILRCFDQFDGDFDRSSWEDTITECLDKPADYLPDFKQPIQPKLVLGKFDSSPLDAEAMVITWVVNNSEEGSKSYEQAVEWENNLQEILKTAQLEAAKKGLRMSFNTEISLTQELNQSTNTDAAIVVISYIIMFIYASLALGSTTISVFQVFRTPSRALVQSKFMLGIIGILIVLLSVSASVGLFSAVGIKVTLIIAEVIPFLVLAVGVDNIFLIVHEFERVNSHYPEDLVEERMARALGRMGPSILLSSSMETVAFALGAFVDMPAVRNFAAYAAGAVFINALLQVTMFVATLALNQRRVEDNRVDCFPCVRVKSAGVVYAGNSAAGIPEEDGLQRFIRRVYAPALLGKKTKVAIITIFLGLFTIGMALLPEVELGLDQRIAIPSGSYLIDYFNDIAQYFESGPPVYFVTRELNVTKREHQKQLCGRFTTCNQYSLANLIEGEQKRPEVSYIADAAASWVDDFFLWLNPGTDCCIDPKTNRPCFEDRDPPYNRTLYGMPEGAEYMQYLDSWRKMIPDENCPLAGKAAYGDALVLSEKRLTIPASHFRSAHTPLRTQSDFISALASARRIASDIESNNPGTSVFPYSNFYVFFDQYSTIIGLTFKLLGSAIAVSFLVSSLLLGSLRTGLVMSITVIMTLVDIGGAMAIAGVSLNALTLVNLVICVGIAVEFCAHIARAFQFPSSRFLDRSGSSAVSAPAPSSSFNGRNTQAPKLNILSGAVGFRGKDARVWAAMSQVGASVFSGITITKLLGVCVLAFTRSKIFEIYYFRVWLALIIFAALHALVFFPVALSLFGGEGYIDPMSDDSLEEDLARRRGRGRPQFGDEDEEYDEYEDDEY